MSAQQPVAVHRCATQQRHTASIRIPGRRRRPDRQSRLVSCVVIGVLLLSACGQQGTGLRPDPSPSGSPSSASTRLTADDLKAATNLRRDFQRNGSFFPGKDRCFATGLVREFGVKKLVAVGLLNKDLAVRQDALNGRGPFSTRDADRVVDVTFSCVNWRLLAMSLVDDEPNLRDKYDRRCTAAITERDVRELWVTAFSGPPPPRDDLPPLFKKLEKAGCGFEGDG